MDKELRILIWVLAINALLVLLYLIWNRFLRKNKRRPSYVLRSVVMLLCPVVGICFFLFGKFFFRLFFRKPVDLEDVIFSKDRVKTLLKADEKERDYVPMEEALAVTDTGNTRLLMLEVVRRDISTSLATISLTLNSDDSEVSHYAASVLQETLGKLRMDIQRMRQQVFALEQEVSEYDHEDELLRTENGMLTQKRLSMTPEEWEAELEATRAAQENSSEEDAEQELAEKYGAGANAVLYREEDIMLRTREQAYAQALIARDGIPDEASKDIAEKLLDEVDHARELMDSLHLVLRQHVFSPLEQSSCLQTMEEMARLLDRRDVLSPAELHIIAMQQLDAGNMELCRSWCERAKLLWPGELSTYTSCLKLHYLAREREAFFAELSALKSSGIPLDHDTLELVRLFM